jgi:L-ornithine N5-oxygenase
MSDSIDYDIAGVGFGPANLALAVALQDSHSRMKHVFYEQKPTFSWHLGMQMEGSSMQTPFLEDLVTRHNPRSKFTFLNYLKVNGRLTDFADLRDFFPTRLEFNDYFQWCAKGFAQAVRYDTVVTSIAPVAGDGEIVEALEIGLTNARTGEREFVRTRNAVLGLGYTPVMPKSASTEQNGRVFHSITTLPSLDGRFASKEAPYSFMVAGGGQSAAEIVLHLLRQYRNARVTVVSRGFVFRSKDSNAFVSAFYTGGAADDFYDLDDESRRMLLATLDESNYSAADADLLRELAKTVYADKVEGRKRLDLRSFTELSDVEETSSKVKATCWSRTDKAATTVEVDGLCLATGFNDAALKYALTGVNEFIKRDATDEYCVNREYRLETKPGFKPGIYVQGYARNYHGCTEGTISDLPHRAHRIIESIHHQRYERYERDEQTTQPIARQIANGKVNA